VYVPTAQWDLRGDGGQRNSGNGGKRGD